MHILLTLRALALALLVLVILAPASFAQSSIVDGGSIFGAWRPWIVEIVGIIIFGIVGWAANLFRAKTGIEIGEARQRTLQLALTNAAGMVINTAGGAAAAIKLDVKSPALAEGIEYVLKGAPDALAYFGITPARLREMLYAKIGVVAAPATAEPAAPAT